MKKILDIARERVGAFLAWVSPLPRLFPFLLALCFAISLASWAFFAKETGYVLYFPQAGSKGLRGEARDLPRRGAVESRAEALVSELLLGPRDPRLVPSFPGGTKLDGILFRKGTLYIDLGEDAALVPEPDLRLALDSLKRTVGLGIHQARRLVVTIGGFEPWAGGAPPEARSGGEKP